MEEKIQKLIKCLKVYAQGADHPYSVERTTIVAGQTVSTMKSFVKYSKLAQQCLDEIEEK